LTKCYRFSKYYKKNQRYLRALALCNHEGAQKSIYLFDFIYGRTSILGRDKVSNKKKVF
jgi:hypothetical protein